MPCPYRAHAVSLTCRAAKGLECVFPFDLHSAAMSDSHLPCPSYAPTMPFFSRPRHSTSVERRPVGYLPAFGFLRLPRGVPRRLLSDAYQSQMQVVSVKPNTVCHGRGRVVAARYKKNDLLHCWTSSSDISGYHADFHEGHITIGAGQGRAMAYVN